MKKIFTTLLASVAIFAGLQAQNHNLRIHFADGSQKVYHVEKIDSVTFEEAPDFSNLAFDIKLSDITTNGVTTTISSNRPDVLWYSDAFEKGSIEGYTPAQVAQAQIEAMWEEWLAYEDYYKEEYGDDITFADFFFPGDYTEEYTYNNLDPSTEYVIIAFGIDLNLLEVAGEPDTVSFATLAPEPSDNQISFSLENDTLYIHTTNNDPYFWESFLPEELADYGAETATEAYDALVEQMVAWDYMEYFLSSGDEANAVKSYFYGLPGTHTIVAAGWNGVRTTEYFTFELTLTEDQVGGNYDDEDLAAPARKITIAQKQVVPVEKGLQFHTSKRLPRK